MNLGKVLRKHVAALVSPVNKEGFWFPAEDLIFKEGSLLFLFYFLVNPHPMIFFPLMFRDRGRAGGKEGERNIYVRQTHL